MKENRIALPGTSLPEMWLKSGMTQEEFARVNNLSVHRLRYWLYKRKDALGASENFVEINMPAFGSGFLIRYPNGIELSAPVLTPLQTLKGLINI